MKNQILILSACCLLFIVGSCTKFGKNITVEGNVINPINGEPYEGITIVLHKQNLKTIKTTITNANGHFEINASRLGEVLIRADNTNYKENYNLGWDVDGKYYYSIKVDKGEVMHVDYHLVPYGELNLNIKNINCEGITDIMWLRKKWQYDEGYGAWPQLSREGCYQNLTGASTVPVGEYIYQIKVQRASGDTIMEFPGIVYENQLTTFEIYY